MVDLLRLIIGLVVDLFRSRAALEAEILVLRQQIIVLRRAKPPRVCTENLIRRAETSGPAILVMKAAKNRS